MAVDATVIGPRIRMVTAGGLYELQGVQCRFAANGINVCIATLAVGRKETGDSTVFIGFDRGDEARIIVNGATGFSTGSQAPNQTVAFNVDDYDLFDGVIDDFGPGSLKFGQFSVQVRIFGRLALLASGTLGSSSVSPSSHLDTAVFFAYGTGSGDAPGMINLTDVQVGFWQPLRDAMQAIALQSNAPENSVAKAVQQLFGADVNAAAAGLLDEIQGGLDWNSRSRQFATGITTSLNALMMSQWQFDSFFQRIVKMGELLRFKLVENGSALRVVPYTPFFSRQDALIVGPRTYDQFGWDNKSEFRNYAGCVLVEGAHHDISDPAAVGVVGSYRLPGNNPYGQAHVGTVPAWLGTIDENMFTGGGGARAFTALSSSGLGDRLAKFMTWELNYQNRRFSFSCPFLRADIGPLEAVRLDFPSAPEIIGGTDTPAIYGSVETVDVTIDATARAARTTYSVGYARSYQQQQRQIDPDLDPGEHPFWGTNYVGGRLDTEQTRGPSVG